MPVQRTTSGRAAPETRHAPFPRLQEFPQRGDRLVPPLTILIGPNGSGKTNALEAIEVLSTIASGTPLHEIADFGRTATLNVRGGLQGCVRRGSETFSLSFTAKTRWQRKIHGIRYQLSVKPRPEPRIAAESVWLTDNDTMLFETLGTDSPSSADIRIQYNNFAQGGRKPQVSAAATRSMLSLYEQFAVKNRRLHASIRQISAVRRYLAASFVFDPKPHAMRGYERTGQDMLRRDGSNLSSVLFGLKQNGSEGQEVLDSLFESIRHVPEESYSQFEFIETPADDVMLGLREQGADVPTDARVLSDGTLRALAVLTAVATIPEGSRVVVEEFDNGLHPSRVSELVAAVADMGEKRSVNVVLTTHNPVTLDSLTAKQQQGVVIAFRSLSDGSSQLRRLVELPPPRRTLGAGHSRWSRHATHRRSVLRR